MKHYLKGTLAEVFSCEFWANVQKTFFTEIVWMTAPADSSVPTKVFLSIDQTTFIFSLWENYESLLRKCLEIKIFLFFAIVYSKINMNVVKGTLMQIWKSANIFVFV